MAFSQPARREASALLGECQPPASARPYQSARRILDRATLELDSLLWRGGVERRWRQLGVLGEVRRALTPDQKRTTRHKAANG